MRIFKTKIFAEWAKKVKLIDATLYKVIEEVSQGQYEASLGGNLYKKRIAISNKGKSSGIRTIIALQVDDKAFYMYGFSKNKRANINEREKAALKKLAKTYLAYDDNKIKEGLTIKAFMEIKP